MLLGAAGELATFTAAGKRPAEFPPYRHEALTETFLPVFFAIRQSLSMVMDPAAVPIPLEERRFGIRVGIIHDRSLLEGAAFVLVVSADMDSDCSPGHSARKARSGRSKKFANWSTWRCRGCRCGRGRWHLASSPIMRVTVYFELDTSSELWRELERSGGLAIHVAGNLPNLAMELWAIKR